MSQCQQCDGRMTCRASGCGTSCICRAIDRPRTDYFFRDVAPMKSGLETRTAAAQRSDWSGIAPAAMQRRSSRPKPCVRTMRGMLCEAATFEVDSTDGVKEGT
jgi:hypothetical protein